MTVKKDGISYGVKYLNSTLLIAQGARRLDIRAALDSGTFVLTVSDYDVNVQPEDGIKVQTYFQDYSKKVCKKEGMISYCAGMLGTYTRDNKLYITDAFGTDGTIAVSSMDTINRKVSGTFSFEVFFRSESKIFSGTFSNVCYTVLK